jgi:uncharacterized protein (DUF3084 family)
MFWTILALIFLMVLGGFVSYYGDLQGRRWGKKRVSWFGMRPKHTAILITTLTGSAIVILSAGAIMLAVPNIRNVILYGEHAIRENKVILSEQKKLNAESAQKNAQLNSQLRATQGQLANKNHDLEEERQQLDQLTKQVNALKQKQQTLITQTAELQQKQVTLLVRNKQLTQKNEQLVESNKKQVTINTDQAAINKLLGEQNYRYSRENVELSKTNTDLQNEKATLQKDIAGLHKQVTNLTSLNEGIYNDNKNKILELQATRQELSGLKQERDKLLQERDSLQQEFSELYGQIVGANKNILQNFEMLRRGRFNIRANSELARLTIAPHLRPEAVRSQLVQLLMNAGEAAHKLGARSEMGGREVHIVPKQLVTLTGLQKADENASLDALAENLSGRDKPTVVVANTVSNSVVGEMVMVELRPYQIDHVYDRGAKIAARRIDARQPVDKIIENLVQFLQQDVRVAAIRAGALPRINPETGQPEIGIMGTADLFQLTERIRKVGGDVQLTATARREVSSADPLNLDFKVVRVNDRDDATAEKP